MTASASGQVPGALVAPADPREVALEDYPGPAPTEARLRFLLNYAVLAPSSHNSQPWLFRIRGGEVELLADRTRALPVVDPDDRALVMSCGAALFHLRVAIRYFGHLGMVRPLSEPAGPDFLAPVRHLPDVLARVALGPEEVPDEEWESLFEAIPARHTNRNRYEDRVPPHGLLEELERAAREEGARLTLIRDPETRTALAELVAEGDRIQGADPRFRRELGAWLHPNRTRSREGMPGYAFGVSDMASWVGPLIVRTFDWGQGRAAKDRELAEGSPVLAVLGTERDVPFDWLMAGQALDRVLLRATADGVSASFLNQPVEVPELRPRVRDLAGGRDHPQLVIRLGYGPPVERPTPRRPVADVLVD